MRKVCVDSSYAIRTLVRWGRHILCVLNVICLKSGHRRRQNLGTGVSISISILRLMTDGCNGDIQQRVIRFILKETLAVLQRMNTNVRDNHKMIGF